MLFYIKSSFLYIDRARGGRIAGGRYATGALGPDRQPTGVQWKSCDRMPRSSQFGINSSFVGAIHTMKRRVISWSGKESKRVPSLRMYAPSRELRNLIIADGFHTPSLRGRSDIARVIAVMHWANSRWTHDGGNDPGTGDPVALLNRARRGERFRCVEFSIVAVAAARSLNLRARIVGLWRADVPTAKFSAGHVVCEVFSPTYSKWVMVDPQFGRIPIVAGVPVGAAEFARAASAGLPIKFLDSTRPPSSDAKYLRWISKYLFFIRLRVDQRFGLNDRNFDQLILIPKGASTPKSFQRVPIPGTVIPIYSVRRIYGPKIARALSGRPDLVFSRPAAPHVETLLGRGAMDGKPLTARAIRTARNPHRRR